MSDDEVFRKFRGLASDVLPSAAAERIIEQCMTFEGLKDVAALLEFERGAAPVARKGAPRKRTAAVAPRAKAKRPATIKKKATSGRKSGKKRRR